MSKRITLTDREIAYIVEALTTARNESSLAKSYAVIRVGQATYDDIIAKLSSFPPK